MSRHRRGLDTLVPIGQWGALGLGFAGWLYAAQIGSWAFERNQYHDFWSRLDVWAIVIGVFGTAILTSLAAWGYPNDPKRSDLVGRTVELGIYNLAFLTDPVSRWAYRVYQAEHFSRHWRRRVATVIDDTWKVLDRDGSDVFAVFHWPLPHGPFIFDADGRYRGPYDARFDTMFGTPEDYRRHLRLLDRRVGEIVEHLRAKGRFDEALIVLTSDHSWRRDPQLPTTPNAPERRHVPLLIKFPGQREPQESWEPMELSELGRWIMPWLDEEDIGP